MGYDVYASIDRNEVILRQARTGERIVLDMDSVAIVSRMICRARYKARGKRK